MEKYNIKTVLDYRSGNDIEGFTLDELESNPEFMADVVSIDKNAINLCSKDIKMNYIFVKKVLEQCDDKELIEKLATTFVTKKLTDVFNNTEIKVINGKKKTMPIDYDLLLKDREELLTICILADDKLRLESEEDRILFKSIAKKDFFNYYMHVNYVINNMLPENIKKFAGYGFIYVNNDDKTIRNDTIRNFFADHFLLAMVKTDIDLEDLLHSRYKSYEQLESLGLVKTVIDIIKCRDISLAEYVGCNFTKLKWFNRYLNGIKKNWDAYEYHIHSINEAFENDDYNPYNKIIAITNDYLEKHPSELKLREVITYISKKHKVDTIMNKCLNKYAPVVLEDYDGKRIIDERSFEDEYPSAEAKINKLKNNIIEMGILKKIDKMFTDEFDITKKEPELYGFDENEYIKVKPKLLQFKPKDEDIFE